MTIATLTPTRFSELALPIARRGWESLLPLNGKAPIPQAWQQYNQDRVPQELLEKWCHEHPDAGLGIAAGVNPVIAVDVDVLDPAKAARISKIADEILGVTPIKRVGRAPKFLSLYQRHPNLVIDGRQFGQIEKFVRSGQYAGYGVHPITGKPYHYVNGYDLRDIAPTDLPMVSPSQINDFMAQLAAEGLRTKSNSPNARIATSAEIEAIRSAAKAAIAAAAAERSGAPRATRTGPSNGMADRAAIAPLTLGGGNGDAAGILPILRRADDPIETAAKILAGAQEGERHPTMVGVVHSLCEMLHTDEEISALEDVYAALFDASEAGERCVSFQRMLRWSRGRIGDDGDKILQLVDHASIREKWLSRRRMPAVRGPR